jgi:hypothetical protein
MGFPTGHHHDDSRNLRGYHRPAGQGGFRVGIALGPALIVIGILLVAESQLSVDFIQSTGWLLWVQQTFASWGLPVALVGPVCIAAGLIVLGLHNTPDGD